MNPTDDNTTNKPITPVSPTGSMSKEQGPVETAKKETGDEYWENYAREIELEKKILEIGGVEKVENGEVSVPENLAKEMGIKPTVEIQTPIAQTTNAFSIRGTSLTDDQLTAGITKPTSSGFRWLVEWFIYQLLKAHFHVKRIKGQIVRQK